MDFAHLNLPNNISNIREKTLTRIVYRKTYDLSTRQLKMYRINHTETSNTQFQSAINLQHHYYVTDLLFIYHL